MPIMLLFYIKRQPSNLVKANFPHHASHCSTVDQKMKHVNNKNKDEDFSIKHNHKLVSHIPKRKTTNSSKQTVIPWSMSKSMK